MDLTSLDKNSSEQLYLQIRRMVLKAIQARELLPGERIPSVNELSRGTEVSRMTIRQALQALIDEGYLYTVPGKGTFVASRPHIEQNLQQLLGWTEEIQAQGMRPSTRLVGVEIIPADRQMAHHLSIQPGEELFRLVRVRCADDFPLSLEKAHLPVRRFPDLDRKMQQTASLYQVLRKVYNTVPVRALQFLEVGEADQLAAEQLNLALSAPVLVSERISFTASNEPVEYVHGMTRPGFVRFRAELNARGPVVRQVTVPVEGASNVD